MSAAQAGTSASSRKSFAQVAAAANKPAIPHVKTPSQTVDSTINEQRPSRNVLNDGIPSLVPNNASTTNPASQPMTTPQSGALTGSLSRMMKETSIDDRSPHASSVGNTGKKDNSDTKSTASRTTLTLDEKESLRPDDSASMQGVHDEEVTSPAEHTHLGDTMNGDPDARAFRNQLYEIDRHEAKPVQLAPRLLPREPTPHQNSVPVIFPQPPLRSEVSDLPHGPAPSGGPPPGLVVPPDEKLLEALNSPKDRLFVLKIEQDFIDFIANSKELELQLPSTNTFYRLLSHKLAEYYFLGHVYEESLKAVRIRRLPHTRLAPALIGSEPKSGAATPPPAGSMTIMRRGVGDCTLPSTDARPQSSSGVEDGNKNSADSGKDDQKRSLDKSHLTREEREKQYAEVRARIFEDVKEGASENGDTNGQSKEMSRSSSNSGPKKNKRGKKPKDDSFEARSSYVSINGQIYPNSLMQAPTDVAYYNGFSAYPQYSTVPSTYPPNSQAYQVPPQDFSNTAAWQGQTPYAQTLHTHPHAANFDQFNTSHYDPSSGYYQPPQLTSRSTPKPHQPELAGYYHAYPNQADASGWVQQGYQGSYGQPPMYSMNPGQPGSMMPHGYDPNAVHNQGYSPYGQQQFNPQSQTFVPNAQVVPVSGWQHHSTATYPSPHFQQQHSPRKGGQQANNRGKGNSFHNQAPQTQTSSIAKWATPSSLPAKPPPTNSTLSFQMPRHMEQGQPLPSKPLGANGRI